jgi:protease II
MAIYSIKDDGTYFQIYDANDKLISQKPHDRSDVICGHSEKIVIIDEGIYFRSYNEDFKELGAISHSPSEKILAVSDEEITISDYRFAFGNL